MRIGLLATIAGVLSFACSEAKDASTKPSNAATAAAKPAKQISKDGDPTGGEFTLAAALEGLDGTGPLMATLKTNRGTLVAKLFEKEVPNTVANFVGLARGKRPFRDPKSGEWVTRPFFDGLTFHRVIPNFMIQGGCPLGSGVGTPGYKFADELHAKLVHDKPGILSMANSGPNTNGSQFFITERPTPHLDKRHAVFGEIVEGLELLKKIARVPTEPGNRPKEPVVIEKLTIHRL